MRRLVSALMLTLTTASSARSQSVARDIVAHDGQVDVLFPARAEVCGDGRSFIRGVFGDEVTYTQGEWVDDHQRAPCVHGPARVTVSVVGGEITRLQTTVGPMNASSDRRTLSVTAAQASDWLAAITSNESSRLARQSLLPLVLADGPPPWPRLLAIARDANRPTDVRRSVLTWLASAVSVHVGVENTRQDDDAELRTQAVFTLSQRPRGESVPMLIDLARNGKHSDVRKAAIFWLGQSGDPRAVDVYAELLGLR